MEDQHCDPEATGLPSARICSGFVNNQVGGMWAAPPDQDQLLPKCPSKLFAGLLICCADYHLRCYLTQPIIASIMFGSGHNTLSRGSFTCGITTDTGYDDGRLAPRAMADSTSVSPRE